MPQGCLPDCSSDGMNFFITMEHVALYRQFRPKTFDEIVEQKAPVAALKQSVRTGRIGHAYLFCGQRGTGKTSIARVFSRAINCENPKDGNPCNECPTCKGILDGSLMDVIEIDAASNRSIDNIRKICEEVTYSPSKASHKVYIIDEVHMITTDAFNALLKTLEEPPKHAVFLFATTEPHQIPATILSRCQRFDFRRISQEAIEGRLRYISDQEKIDIDDDALRLIASLSDGAMRDAISILDQAASAADNKKITAADIESMTGTVNTDFLAAMAEILIEGRYDELLIKCDELARSGRDTIQFTLDLAGFFRNLLIVRTVPEPWNLIPASPATYTKMYNVANKTSSQTLVAFVSMLSKIVSDLKWSPSVRTSFEISLLRLCGRKVKMEEPLTPLVIPDFAKKQAEAAKSVSVAAPAPEKKAEEPEKETTPAPEEEAKAEPEAKPEEKKEAPAADPLESIKARIDLMKAKATIPAPAPAPAPKEEPEIVMHDIIPDKTETEEETEDETPMENQMDIFSIPEKKPEPAPSPAPAPAEGVRPANPFAGLSDSFLDDVKIGDEPGNDLYEPTGRIGETRKTALSAAVEANPIVTRKETALPVFEEGTDPSRVWDVILERVERDDFILHSFLSKATLRTTGEDAYIIFGDQDRNIIEQLKGDPNYKKVSTDIKNSLQGINHVFLSTEAMLSNKFKKADGNGGATAPNAGVNDFINQCKEMGINTEIHFGDD